MSETVERTRSDRQWWEEAVVYQIYPKSFFDSDGDGIGDLAGITEKVDYLDALGVDAVWLCPVYDSPQADNGYDIRDYRSIFDTYGDMADWERLLAELHDRNIRLVMDLVVNHTSAEHEWFQHSRRGESEYADYYHWRDGRPAETADYDTDDGPADEVAPNNWDSIFGGPAWAYDEERGQWYLHLFDESQPDLNWENEAVREDVYEMMRWWLDRGIDGFRMDVINLVSKTPGLPDGDPESGLVGAEHFMNGPKVHDYLSELVAEAIPDDEILTVGETPGAGVEDAQRFVGEDGLSMVFQFEHVNVGHEGDKWSLEDYSLVELKESLARWQNGLADEGWNSLYLSNHDQPRTVSRFGDDGRYRRRSAKLFGTLLYTLQGTPFVYQGQEIGMTNAPFESKSELRDVESINFVEEAIESGAAESYEDVRDAVETVGRDNARTPMQWSDDENAGFTDGEPWLKVNPNYDAINVERARADPDSVWHYYRELGDLRGNRDLLVYGDFELLAPGDEQVFAYTRTLGDERALVVLNVSAEPATFAVPDDAGDDLELAIGNLNALETPGSTVELDPYEARVYLTPATDTDRPTTTNSDST
ncbi:MULTISPECIES: glycoside hydrolase family 13 protein [Halomicrobium]|uniref:Alpha amylase catalytic region n=2 Tax=Halomicrobium mukohataei TaxID=57705 RepID=C7NVT7_HALMD|nr:MULTISPECIES: alpha-glucosidase [Halomicrobium]ACV46202.1 alpha amylase catalytic region [Halomicrobium mukohataei DSM 12286]QCD64767.1 alpha-glucosidase [Halomicrobium mukohataei]QFR19574.1 alpha,alpha-phosphotrehalase [Halomicrobium sp. ZPS1]